jgi:hypothetical protein
MPNIPEGLPRKNDLVQSVLINKKLYSLKDAKKILREMEYYNYGVRETKNFFRFRQFNPNEEDSYFTIKSNIYPGIMFIIESKY